MCSSKVCEWFAAPEADANGMMPMQKNAVSPLSIGPLQKVAKRRSSDLEMYGVSINWKEWKRSLSMKWCYYSYSKTALDTRPRHISLCEKTQWIMADINNPFLAKNFLWIIDWNSEFCRHCRRFHTSFSRPQNDGKFKNESAFFLKWDFFEKLSPKMSHTNITI